MGGGIELPIKSSKGISIIKIPQYIFGKRVIIQAHDIKRVNRGRDVLDGHECDETEAVGDIKFFSTRMMDISKLKDKLF